ncbi:MAG TPA: S8 family serine peptidase [Actinomycetota bacterium]|nr:S8 family serine peptidase [Actinomycetota bacterium]
MLTIGPATEGVELYDETSSQIVGGNVSAGTVAPGYRAFLDARGVDGTGVTIAIADSGIDDNHPDLAGRVAARTDFTALPDLKDSDGHGTHVAGIAGGGGVLAPNGNDPKGFTYGLGVAPGATLVDVGVLGIIEEAVGVDDFPPFEAASRYAVRNGAIGWNASWGSGEGPQAGYVTSARTMDVIARDADWETPGAQPFILVFAAGNDGTSGMGAPNEAKNLISVAASRSTRAGDIDTIAGFSSRGPTRDGRIGPTVTAPGESVVSTRGLPATVLCNTPPRDAAPLVGLYGVCSGTSMAAPHVTGAVAVVTQWWRQRHGGVTPSPAMVKALLVNSATDMKAADIPNRHEGWGRVNLRELLDPASHRIEIDGTVVFGEPGDDYTLEVRPVDPSRPMKVSLAWSDAPAAPNAAIALVNDLDLTVTTDGASYVGNRFAGGTSVTGGTPDRREVNENVFVAAPSGTYLVRVSAANVPGDGVPFAGDATDQDFALVLTNATLVG